MEAADATMRALLLLARVPLGARAGEVRRLLEQGVDFERLHELAVRGGVAGAVAAGLEEAGLDLVPSKYVRSFTASRLFTEAANRRLLGEATRLMLAGQRREVTLVPIKGIALLMNRPYGDLGLRTLVDIDFLVSRQHYAEVEALLRDEGYEPDARRDHAMRHEHHVCFFGMVDGARLMVELHWTPFYTLYGSAPQDEALFGRLVPHEYQGNTFRLLDLEDTLLVLLSHLAHHRFRGQLKWAADVAALIDVLGGELDWPMFWERGRRLGAARGLAYGLWLVEQLFGGSASLTREHVLPLPVRLALRRLNEPERLVLGEGQPPVWQRTITDFLLQDRLRDSLRYLLYKIPELLERETSTEVPDTLVRGGPESKR